MIDTASFRDWRPAIEVLQAWRHADADHARAVLREHQDSGSAGLLLSELDLRLSSQPAPRLLIDGLWFSRPHGGITRVWQHILSSWLLPGLITPAAPIAIIDRNSHLSVTAGFEALEAADVDPLDLQAVAELADANGQLAREWGAQVFCSSWISSTSPDAPVCPELALVHDCMPERFRSPDPVLLPLRRRWWAGASAHLTVSSATAQDLKGLLPSSVAPPQWCHLAPASAFSDVDVGPEWLRLWKRLKKEAALPEQFLLLPATSGIGSYKNPELLARALDDPSLSGLPLVLCGIGASERARDLETHFTSLRGRVHAAGFTDLELSLAYRHALAVVIPSRIEGFGLPAIEVMASGGVALIADARGLREAGGEAALRFPFDQPFHLRALIKLLMDPVCAPWVRSKLQCRVEQRLQRLNPDLLGLALLAQARQIAQNA